MINAIPKGQFIRIRRICTNLELYWKHAASYINFFVERYYNTQKLQSIASDVAKMDREELFCYKPREISKVSNTPKDLFTQWHPQISKLRFILNKHKEILTDSEMLSCCFPDSPKVMYRRKRNLKDILCKLDISSTSVRKESFVHNQPCNHGNCKLCPSFAKSNTILSSKNDRKMKIE